MDSAAQLALMSKAKIVFCRGKEDVFLSFPVSPLPYTKRQLDFFSEKDSADLRQSKLNLQAFSTLVNLIPSDEAWLPMETRFLWDVYAEVLEADYAESSRTPGEEVEYQQARAYLTPDGPLLAYRRHRDAHVIALEAYTNAKLTGEHATDPAHQKQWRDVDEPKHRAKIDALLTEWIVSGHKAEVETAQSKLVTLGAKSPWITKENWNSQFNKDIDAEAVASDTTTFYPSIFYPTNAVEEGAWQPFTLSEGEVVDLLNEAPAELRARWGVDSTTSKVKSLNFEFSSAAIQREWFESSAFRERFWRFTDAGKVFSDGSKPPSGECPAYVSAVVFARKVAVTEKEAAPDAPSTKPFDGFRFTVAVKDPARLTQVRPQVLMQAHIRPAEATLSTRPPMAHASSAQVLRWRAMSMKHATPTAPQAAHLRVPPAATAAKASRRPLTSYKATAYTRLPQTTIKTTPTPDPRPSAPQASDPVAPTMQDDSIYILAFICKALPKCPDPDLSLQW